MKRGRKSALSVVATIGTSSRRPDPPASLQEELHGRWAEIVNDWPADRWRPSDLQILEDMIITEHYVRLCDAAISRDGMTIQAANGNLVAHPAATLRGVHLASILSAQRALRLCPSTRVRAEKASLHDRAGAGGVRPWEVKK
jgi:Phage terminase, small subunit